MKKFVVFCAFLCFSGITSLEAMERYEHESKLHQELTKLDTDPSFSLKSLYKKLIVTLSTEDVNKLHFLLDREVLHDKQYTCHMLFLKYVIHRMQGDQVGCYSEAKEIGRVKVYSQLVHSKTLSANDRAWLRSREKLDELLQGIESIGHSFAETVYMQLVKLARALASTITHVPSVPEVAYLKKQEDAACYFQEEYCSKLLPYNKKLLLDCVLNTVCAYRPAEQKDFLAERLQSRATSDSQDFIESVQSLARKVSPSSSIEPSVAYESTMTPVMRAIAKFVEHMPDEQVKFLVYLFINPYIQPQARRIILALKCFALSTVLEEPGVGSPSAESLKQKLIDLMRYLNKIPLYKEEIASFLKFVSELQDVITKNSSVKEGHSIHYQMRCLNNLPSFKKQLLQELISVLKARLIRLHESHSRDKRKRAEDEEPIEGNKSSRVDEERSPNQHYIIEACLRRLTQLEDSELRRQLVQDMLAQSPFKEEIAVLLQEKLLQRDASVVQPPSVIDDTEQLRKHVGELEAHITSLDKKIQALEQEKALQMEERMAEQQRYEELYSSYETMLQDLRTERDTYKQELEALQSRKSEAPGTSQHMQWL